MRSYTLLMLVVVARAVPAQEAAPHVATKSTPIRTAPVNGTSVTPAVGQLAKGATVDVRESDLVVSDSSLRPLSAADIRSDPLNARGKLVHWDIEAVALQTADALRTGLQQGEPYLLALGPGAEKTLVYIAVPESLLASARSLPPLAHVTITARVRDGRSEPAGVPILDLQSLTRQ